MSTPSRNLLLIGILTAVMSLAASAKCPTMYLDVESVFGPENATEGEFGVGIPCAYKEKRIGPDTRSRC